MLDVHEPGGRAGRLAEDLQAGRLRAFVPSALAARPISDDDRAGRTRQEPREVEFAHRRPGGPWPRRRRGLGEALQGLGGRLGHQADAEHRQGSPWPLHASRTPCRVKDIHVAAILTAMVNRPVREDSWTLLQRRPKIFRFTCGRRARWTVWTEATSPSRSPARPVLRERNLANERCAVRRNRLHAKQAGMARVRIVTIVRRPAAVRQGGGRQPGHRGLQRGEPTTRPSTKRSSTRASTTTPTCRRSSSTNWRFPAGGQPGGRVRSAWRADRPHAGAARAGPAARIGPTGCSSTATRTRRWPAPWRPPSCTCRSPTWRPDCGPSTGACRRRSTALSPTGSARCSSARPRRPSQPGRRGRHRGVTRWAT